MSVRPRQSFAQLGPVSDRYAMLPVAEAFTWEACAADVEPGEWYMVAFRSIRRTDADEAPIPGRRGSPDRARRLGPRRGHGCVRLRALLQGSDPGRRPMHVVLPVGQPGRGPRRVRPPGARRGGGRDPRGVLGVHARVLPGSPDRGRRRLHLRAIRRRRAMADRRAGGATRVHAAATRSGAGRDR